MRRLFAAPNRILNCLPTAFQKKKKASVVRLHKENCDDINRDEVISGARPNHNVPELCVWVCVLLCVFSCFVG